MFNIEPWTSVKVVEYTPFVQLSLMAVVQLNSNHEQDYLFRYVACG